MRTSLNLLLTALLGVLPSGCGTVCNLTGGVVHPETEPRIYGGVIRDVEVFESLESRPSSEPLFAGANKGAVALGFMILCLGSVDPVVSFVADTLTLPITIPLQNRRIALERESSTPPSGTLPASQLSPCQALRLDLLFRTGEPRAQEVRRCSSS